MRWVKAATAALFAALAVVILLTFPDYGISWDEELHVPYGRMLLSYYTSGFADRSAFSFINLYQYGGFFDLLAALAEHIFPFGEYETRHLVGGLFFLLGLFGAWRLANLLAGERAAFLAVVCLIATPMLYGHSFINPKDAPLAWLGVWVAYFTCRALGERPVAWRTVAGLGVSLGLALGTRIIAFAFIAQIGAVVALKVAIEIGARGPWPERGRRAWELIRPFAAAMPLAAIVMAITWPWSVQNPLNILAAFRDSANQFWNPAMLWAGELVTAGDLPRSYLLVLLAVKLPEAVLAGAAMLAVSAAAQARAWGRSALNEPRTFQYLYVVSTVIVPLAAFALWRPNTYNGVRHFLFVVPQLVILAAVGLDRAWGFLERRRRTLGRIFAVLLIVAFAHEAWRMARVHPYQYLSFNALTGGLRGAYGRFELDYWGVSYGEAARGLAQYLDEERAAGRAMPQRPRLFVCGANTSASYFLPDTVGITDDRTQADFFLGGDLTNPRCRLRPEGPAVVEVTRDGAVLSYVLDLRKGFP
ncbi:MAG: glycosyltransferase family 39 protein [Rhodospirillaceae bacterium]